MKAKYDFFGWNKKFCSLIHFIFTVTDFYTEFTDEFNIEIMNSWSSGCKIASKNLAKKISLTIPA